MKNARRCAAGYSTGGKERGWRGAREGGGGGGGIDECGLGKRTASRRTDVFVFLTAPQPRLTDAGEVTGKKCADWSDEGGKGGRERGEAGMTA